MRTPRFARVTGRAVVATLLAAALAPVAHGQRPSRPTSLELVERLMHVAFPSVGQAPNSLRLSFEPVSTLPWTRPQEMSLHVYRPGEWELGGERAFEERHKRLLGAYILVDPRVDQLEVVSFRGQLVHSKVMEDMGTRLKEQQNPSDSDVLAMLAEHHARYPPEAREAFLKRWNLRDFDAVLGPIDEIDVKFFWREPDFPPGRQNVGMPIWEARIKSLKRSWCGTLAFEPIDGNLYSLFGRACSNR